MATVTGTRRLLDISGNNISTAVSLEAEGTLLDSNGQSGTSNQVLISTATGVDWVDGSGSGIIGGPYLPLSAGSGEILTGDLAMNNNIGIITKDSTGSFRDILKLNSTNVLEIGSSALATDTIFKNTGNVGIGTTSPTADLHIQGSSETDVPILRVGGFGNSGSKLELAETLTSGAMNYGFSFFNDGNSSNTLIIKAHNNSTTGVTAITINRTNSQTTFSTVPVVGTRTAGDNSTYAASTAFVTAAIAAAPQGTVTSVTATAPILSSGGATPIISARVPASGDWWNGGLTQVQTDGVMEVGKYIDMHATDAATSDFDVRLTASTGSLNVSGDIVIGGGDITLSGTGRIQGVDTVSASTDAANKAYVDLEIATRTPYNDIRSLGVEAFTNGTDPNITTAQVMSEIDSDGGFDSYSSVFKTSWSYAGNYNLTDAGRFTETAGSSWITWTDNSSDSTRGNITTLAIAPNTGGSAGGVFIYNDQGSSYSPGWREVWTSTSDGAGSGLDADLLDGQQGSYYLNYANFTGTPTIPSVGNGQIDGRTSGLGLSGSMDATANQSGNTTFTVTSNAATAANANTIAYRTSSADIRARLFRSNYANQSTISGGMAFRVNNGADDYIRFCNDKAAIRTFLGVPASGDLNNYLLNNASDTLQKDHNADTSLTIRNNTNGTAASASLDLRVSGNNFDLTTHSDLFTGKLNVTEFKSTAGGSSFEFTPAGSTIMTMTGSSVSIFGYLAMTGDIRGTGQQLVLNAGEAYSVATGQTNEYVYINAEQGLEVNSSPDNWSSGWAGRNTTYIGKADGTSSFPSKITVASQIGVNTTNFNPQAGIIVNGNQTFGIPGGGSNVNARYLSIEGGADSGGEGSGRLFFSEHNSTTASMDSYGMSIGYRGGPTSIVGASGETWSGLSQIGNGEWGMWGHNNSVNGALIMHGDRAATYVDFSGNNIQGIGDAYIADQIIHTGDTDTYLQFHAANQFRVVTGGTEMLEINDTNVIVASNAILEGKVYINATASIPSRTEEFQVTGRQIITNTGTDGPSLDLGYNSSGSVRLQLGRGRTADGLAYMDFNGEVMPAGSYGFRIIRNSGANAVTQLNQVGTGNLQINASNGADTVFTNTNVGIGNTNPGYKLDVSGNARFTGQTTHSAGLLTSSTQTRDKISVWSSLSSYTIGMKSGFGYGGLGGDSTGTDYAMSFQMSNTTNRGWWWGDTSHTDLQGAMSLTTQGKLVVAKSIKVGAGESTRSAGTSQLTVVAPLSSSGTGTDFQIDGGSGYGMKNVQIEIPAYGDGLRFTSFAASSVDNSAVTFYQDTTKRGSIIVNATSTSYNTTSDYRLKENKEDISDAIERVKLLNPVKFNWISEPNKPKVDGFYAHELAEVVPEAVSGEKDALDYENKPEYQSIDQSKIVPLLAAALQQAIDKIEILEQKIQLIENK